MARPVTAKRRDASDIISTHRLNWPGSMEAEVVALLFSLHRAHDVARSRAMAVWSRHGLTSAEFDVLATLRRSPVPRELTPSEIQNSLLITSGGLTKVMLSLESKGLVSRSRNEQDQRIRPVRLTVSGKRLVERAMTELTSVTGAAIRSSLTADEIAALTVLLGKFVGTAD
jgi:DNA-binding MarR family transcriptional regulator